MKARTPLMMILTAIVGLFLTSTPRSAHAQGMNIDDEALLTTTTLLVAEAVFLPVMMMSVAGGVSSSSSTGLLLHQQRRKRYGAALDQYTSTHRRELDETLAMGAGPAVADLAALLELTEAERQTLPRTLRRERAALTTAMNMTPGPERGEALLTALGR